MQVKISPFQDVKISLRWFHLHRMGTKNDMKCLSYMVHTDTVQSNFIGLVI